MKEMLIGKEDGHPFSSDSRRGLFYDVVCGLVLTVNRKKTRIT